ncbi:type II toxin-antitoxin system antitoxin SocA domain-containing protein [Bifidobacterium sp. SO1]|uniref:Panacea domain-containing protein n=1 Tax=Bifidobacterium sp. SO1 TaxID=2809029 RepID=UPI001F0ABA97|nr:type II toxin-antitoxin system antitoxin SocA domain-containing protein [Bifidobacterium sp. SO1]
MPTMTLQKLVYYSKAWHLAWTGESLFPQRFEAWLNGPVCPELHLAHKGEFLLSRLPVGNPENVADDERASVDSVLDSYDGLRPYELVNQTVSEAPWLDARSKGWHAEITDAAMRDYYGHLIRESAEV